LDRPVPDASRYSAVEELRNGRPVEIRALKPDDRDDLIAAVGRSSAQSIYRRFFGARRHFSEKEIAFFVNVDFNTHVALVAVLQEHGRQQIVGGGRYVVTTPGRAEIAFTVVDQYQGQGVGGVLLRHLATLAREAGLQELIAEVLPDNAPMLKVFRSSGLPMNTTRKADLVEVILKLQ
jgi:RimJ/RimL family protein N-acetyltransferase